MSEQLHDYHLDAVLLNLEAMMEELEKLQTKNDLALKAIEKKFRYAHKAFRKMKTAEINVLRQKEKAVTRELDKLKKENAELRALIPQVSTEAVVNLQEQAAINRACSLAIFDSLLFAMEEWSFDDTPASDFRSVSQSILFRVVYEPIMSGNRDYYLKNVPVAGFELVRRGREYISSIRKSHVAAMTDPDVWKEVAPLVQEWWLNDALPLIYGARDEDWENIEPYTLEQMLEWRDQPASRALNFPLIWDGMELISKYGDEIRETTKIGEFQKLHMQTRLSAHE